MKKTLLSFIGLLVIALPYPALAATVGGGEAYTLPAEETIEDNLYAAGGTLILAGKGEGDMTAVGGKIVLSGNVEGDVAALGGDIDIVGVAQGDARIVAGSVFIAGVVQGDLLVAGGQVHVLRGATVGGDLIVFGGDVSIEGVVRGSVRAYGGTISISGETGPLEIKARQISLSGATVRGDLSYTSSKEALIDETSTIEGKTTRVEVPAPEPYIAGALIFLGGLFFVAKFFAFLAGTLLVFYFLRPLAVRTATEAVASFGKSALVGLAFLILTPVAGVLLLFTVLGAYVGILSLLGYALLLIVAKLFSGIVAGAVLSRAFVREVRVTLPWVLGGILFMQFVFLVPFIGWAISFVICLMSIGVIVRHCIGLWKGKEE